MHNDSRGSAWPAASLDSPPQEREPSFSLQLFGSLTVRCGGAALPKTRSRRDPYLLALLVLRATDAPVARPLIAGALWPDTAEATALYNLRRGLVLLRDALGPEGHRILSPTPRTLLLDLTGDVHCDLREFDAAIRRGDETSLEEAAALYLGPLLLDCFEDWIIGERAAREKAAITALETLAARRRERGDLTGAAECLQRILDLDPLREVTVRAVMETLAAQNSYAAAGEAYRAFRLALRHGLNAEPAPETVRLSRQLQDAGRQRAAAPRTVITPTELGREELPLPIPISRIVGRQAEREAVIARLEKSRLVTLTGTGGVGKTRLSLAVAEAVRADYADGAAFVDLAPLNDAGLLTTTLMGALGIRERNDQTHTAVLETFLQPRQMLLILDNCEHLLAGCSLLAQSLLRTCPHLRILATSREPLRVPAEVIWLVPSLAPEDASELFAERAGQASVTFQMTAINAATVERICARLDGLPLAIEMVAARTRGMSVSRIADKMHETFRLLNVPGSSVNARHQTMQATLDWSCALLSENERRLLARLAIFAGGWTLDAAGDICGGAPLTEQTVLDHLLSLVDKSLVAYSEEGDGSGRYRFLETTRVYAADHLPEYEREPLAYRHAAYFLYLAETAKKSGAGPDEPAQLDRLDREMPNIRAALNWCLTTEFAGPVSTSDGPTPTPAVLGLQLSTAPRRLWWIRGRFAEGRAFVERALERNSAGPRTILHAQAYNALGLMLSQQRDLETSLHCAQAALEIYQSLGDKSSLAGAYHNVAAIKQDLGDIDGAKESVMVALTLLREIGDAHRIQINQRFLDTLSLEAGKDDDALDTLMRDALSAAQAEGNRDSINRSCDALGTIALRQERLTDACAYFRQCVEISHEHGYPIRVPEALENLAEILARQNKLTDLARTYGATEALRENLQCPRSHSHQSTYDANCQQARLTLGDAAYLTAFKEGRAMTTEQSIQHTITAAERPPTISTEEYSQIQND